MRYLTSTLAILSFFLLVGYSQAFVGPTCMRIKEELGDKPDTLYSEFSSRICGKGCKPTIAHYDKWAKNNMVMPMIERVMKEMEIPQHAPTIKRLANAVANSVKKECARALGKQHICKDRKTLINFGQCLEAQLVPVIMGHIGELMPLVTEPMCKKEFSYLQKSTFWEQLIPSYFDAYARVCTKL